MKTVDNSYDIHCCRDIYSRSKSTNFLQSGLDSKLIVQFNKSGMYELTQEGRKQNFKLYQYLAGMLKELQK